MGGKESLNITVKVMNRKLRVKSNMHFEVEAKRSREPLITKLKPFSSGPTGFISAQQVFFSFFLFFSL